MRLNTSFMKELQSKKDEANQEEALKQQQEEFSQLRKLYETGVDSTLEGSSSIQMKLGEDKDFEFELSEEMKKEVREEMLGVNEYHKNFNGDGEILFNKMFEVTAKRLFFDKMLQSAVESTINDGTVKAVKEINNVVDKSNKQNPEPKNGDIMSQIVQGYRKAQGLD